jgi:hypothetical protein
VLVAKAKGKLRAETKVVMTRMATRARIFFTKCSKAGVGCTRHKATGHGVNGNYERALFYKTNGDGEGEYSMVAEARDWAQEHGAIVGAQSALIRKPVKRRITYHGPGAYYILFAIFAVLYSTCTCVVQYYTCITSIVKYAVRTV